MNHIPKYRSFGNKISYVKKQLAVLTFIFLISLLLSNSISAQTPAQKIALDSLKTKFQKDSARLFRFQNVRPYLAIDNRNSFISTAPVNLNGFQLGLIFSERHTIGFGVYNINKQMSQTTKIKDKDVDAIRSLSIGYATFFYDYILLDRKRFQMDMMLEAGSGNYKLKIVDANTKAPLDSAQGKIRPWCSGFNFTFKPTRWVGVGAMVGYRFAFARTDKINFSGLYYSFGLAFDLRQIYRDVRFYWGKKPKYKKRQRHILEKS